MYIKNAEPENRGVGKSVALQFNSVLFPAQGSFSNVDPQWDFACVLCTWLLTNKLKPRIL